MRWADALGTVGEVGTVASGEARRRRPAGVFGERQWLALVVLAACAGLAGAAMSSGTAPLYAGVLLGLAGYLVASQLPRRL